MPSSRTRVVSLIALALGGLVHSTAVAQVNYTFTRMADGSVFPGMTPGGLNDHGEVAFRSFSSFGLGVFRSDGVISLLLAVHTDPLDYFWGADLNNRGQAGCMGVNGGYKVFLDDGPTASLMPTWMSQPLVHAQAPSVNDLGKVAYWGTVGNQTPAIYRSNGITATEVAPPGSWLGTYVQYGDHPSINLAGNVAYIGRRPGTVADVVVHDSTTGANVVIADLSGAFGPFVNIGHVTPINQGGEVAFLAQLTNGSLAIYVGDGTTPPSLYVQTGGAILDFVGDWAINRCGTVGFTARLPGGRTAVLTGPNIVSDMVIRTDAFLDGKKVKSVRFADINNHGQIAFLAAFTDNTVALYRADPVIAPCTPCPWDINGDGSVDGDDLALLLGGGNLLYPTDLLELLAAFGPCP